MPEIRTLNLVDITAPSGEVCTDDYCGPATVDPAALLLPAVREVAVDAVVPVGEADPE